MFMLIFNQFYINVSIELFFFFLPILLNSATSKLVHMSLKLFSLVIFLQVIRKGKE